MATPQAIVHPCTQVPPHPPPGSYVSDAISQHNNAPTNIKSTSHTAGDQSSAVNPDNSCITSNAPSDSSTYSAIDAKFQYETTDGITRWKVNSAEGIEVGLGMKIVLKDLDVGKVIYGVVEKVETMQKGWTLFRLSSSHDAILIIPRSRARLGPISGIIYLFRYLWLANTIPPPIVSTARSLQHHVNYVSQAHI